MAEALHFLERGVERLDADALERAMALYRDRELVGFVLERAAIPGGAERLAFALGPEGDGPFVVVSRTGDFVTCLAEGMRPSGCHILLREQVDALAARHEVWRERWRLARERGEGQRAWRGLQKRLFEEGSCPSRESFAAVAAWHPVLARTIVQQYADVAMNLFPGLIAALPYLKHRPKRRAEEARVQAICKSVHWLGQLSVLLAVDPQRLRIDMERSDAADLTLTNWQCTHPGTILKTAWMIARFGRLLLPHYRRRLRTAQTEGELRDGAFGLLAIGLGNRKLEHEVRQLLRGPSGPSPAWTSPLVGMLTERPGRFDRLFDDRQGCAEATRRPAQPGMHALLLRRVEGAAERWPTPDDVPEEIWRIALFHSDVSFNDFPRGQQLVFEAMPGIIGLEPEELYWPEFIAERLRGSWDWSDSVATLERFRGAGTTPTVRREEPKVGRNEPCPCGSGRKYKRCCAAA